MDRTTRIEQLKAQVQLLEAREREERRKQAVHRKILLGAALLAHFRANPESERKIIGHLGRYITRERDRRALGLSPEGAAPGAAGARPPASSGSET